MANICELRQTNSLWIPISSFVYWVRLRYQALSSSRYRVIVLSTHGLTLACTTREWKSVCYWAFPTTFCFYSFFSLLKCLRRFWRQRKGTCFWHIALMLEPAVSHQSQQVVNLVLKTFADMYAGWNCQKGQSRDTSTTRGTETVRENCKNVDLFTTFELYCGSRIKKRISVVLLTSPGDCSIERLTAYLCLEVYSQGLKWHWQFSLTVLTEDFMWYVLKY